MRLFVLSDIHGSLPSCEMALTKFVESDCDYLILLGDLLYHGPRNPLPEGYQPARVAELLNSYSAKILAVRGNCDAEVDQMVLDFDISTDFKVISLKNRKLYFSHGHIYNPDKLPDGIEKGDIFAFGHIHTPITELIGDYFIFNPGSCTLPKETFPQSYGIIDEDGMTIFHLDGSILRSLRF